MNCRKFRRAWFLALLVAAGQVVAEPVAKLPKDVRFVTETEGIAEYRLGNGLRVLLFPDASKPTLTVNITYLVGSRHENYGETGMAHLLEHLVFKGTPNHRKIPEEFKQRGARFNGTTWLDRTNYYEILPASSDNLNWALALEADRMVNSFIARSDLDTEMTVVRNEFEMGESRPSSVLIKRLQSIAYDWHSYGRSTIGNRSDIENVRIENLQAFYRTYYQPDNAVLLIAGKFEPESALAGVAREFGAIPKPKRALPPFWTVEPNQDGERSFIVRRKADEQYVFVAYKIPSSLLKESGALGVSGRILGATPTGRLHKSLVESGKATKVFAFSMPGYAPGLMIFGAMVKKDDALEPVRDALIREIEAFGAAPPTAEELDRVKLQMVKDSERALNNPEEIGVRLSESIALGDWRLYFLARDRVATQTTEDIAAAAKAYFRRDNRTVGVFQPEDMPQRAELPLIPPLAEVMRDFKPKAAVAAGEAFEPAPKNIQSRTRFEALGDLKVALLPKKTRGETVSVAMRFNMGDEDSLFGKAAISSLTDGLIGRGTDKMTRQQIADAMDKLKMSGGLYRFQTTRDKLDDSLRLAAHVMRDASFPVDQFEQLRKQELTDLDASKSDPGARANESLSRHFNRYPRGDARYTRTIDEAIEDLQKASREDVVAFHRDFYGASNGQVAIVGDFDADSAMTVLKQEFGSWSSRQPYAHVLNQYFDVPPAQFVAATPDKENAVLLAMANFEMKDDAPDFAALLVANQIIGGAPLDSRLANRLRQKDGLSYGVSSWIKVPSLSSAANWGAYAIAAPQNAAKAEQAIREELAKVVADGFTAKEVSDAANGLLKLRTQGRAQDGQLAGDWAQLLFDRRDFGGWVAGLDQAIAAVTPESALAAVRKHLDPSRLSISVGADPAKLAKP